MEEIKLKFKLNLYYRLMNKSFLFIFFFLYSCSHSLYGNDVQEIFGKVRIIDGDSIEINNNKIRLLGIDAFEKKQECFRKNGNNYKCGKDSISALSKIISDQPIRCIAKKKDRYKRWLATCYIGDLDINENMVLYGYAFSYMSKKYKDAENEAKKVKAGAWSGKFNYPWEWRKSNR